jgi:hypothetical protein
VVLVGDVLQLAEFTGDRIDVAGEQPDGRLQLVDLAGGLYDEGLARDERNGGASLDEARDTGDLFQTGLGNQPFPRNSTMRSAVGPL